MALPTNRKVKKKMVAYARRQKPPVRVGPGINLASNKWGPAARTLAWRITRRKANVKTTTRKTFALCKLVGALTRGDLVARQALAEVGVKESPPYSNYGPRVSQYQATTGAYRAPWCASFAAWCYRTAGFRGKLPPTPAWVPGWTAAIRAGVIWRRVAFGGARPGDVVTLWNSQHMEIVIERKGDYLTCVGGNTSAAGQSSAGGMVAKTKRHRSQVTVIGRPK